MITATQLAKVRTLMHPISIVKKTVTPTIDVDTKAITTVEVEAVLWSGIGMYDDETIKKVPPRVSAEPPTRLPDGQVYMFRDDVDTTPSTTTAISALGMDGAIMKIYNRLFTIIETHDNGTQGALLTVDVAAYAI